MQPFKCLAEISSLKNVGKPSGPKPNGFGHWSDEQTQKPLTTFINSLGPWVKFSGLQVDRGQGHLVPPFNYGINPVDISNLEQRGGRYEDEYNKPFFPSSA